MKASLSFLNDEEEEEEEEFFVERKNQERTLPLKKKIAKNPDVDTSHLPDRERDERLRKEKERLTQEWLAEQEIIKNQVSPCLFLPLLCIPQSNESSSRWQKLSIVIGMGQGIEKQLK